MLGVNEHVCSQVLSEMDVDPVRTTSNDICEIFSVSISSLLRRIVHWLQFDAYFVKF